MKIIKYVISYHGIPLLFCSNILHSSVINTAISAGFVIVNYNVELGIFTIKCFGLSDLVYFYDVIIFETSTKGMNPSEFGCIM